MPSLALLIVLAVVLVLVLVVVIVLTMGGLAYVTHRHPSLTQPLAVAVAAVAAVLITR